MGPETTSNFDEARGLGRGAFAETETAGETALDFIPHCRTGLERTFVMKQSVRVTYINEAIAGNVLLGP